MNQFCRFGTGKNYMDPRGSRSATQQKKIMTSVFFYLAPARGEEFIKFLASQPQQGIFTPEQRVIFSAFLELGKILATKSMGQYFTLNFPPTRS
jgi:hypothetical protein